MNIQAILNYYGLLPDYWDGEKEINCLCPFHDDRSPSLSFNIRKDVFHCFVCDASGDIVSLVAQLEQTDTTMQAIKKMASILHASSSAQIKQVVSTKSEDAIQRLKARKRAFDFYNNLPAIDWLKIASSYLYGRGFTVETLKRCGVKYNANSIYALVIPLVEQGEFHGYVTRRIDQVKNRKYLNNTGYARSEVLVGNLTRGRVLVVEGMLDRMKAIQYGYENTTALLNWKISEVQAKKLAGYAEEVVCGLDNDERGDRGFAHLCSVMRPYGIPVVRFPFPSEKKDICELTKQEFLVGWHQPLFAPTRKLVQKAL